MSSCSVSGSPRICFSLIVSIRPSIPAASYGLRTAPCPSRPRKVRFATLLVDRLLWSLLFLIGRRGLGLDAVMVAGRSDGLVRSLASPPRRPSATCSRVCGESRSLIPQIARFSGAERVWTARGRGTRISSLVYERAERECAADVSYKGAQRAASTIIGAVCGAGEAGLCAAAPGSGGARAHRRAGGMSSRAQQGGDALTGRPGDGSASRLRPLRRIGGTPKREHEGVIAHGR
jgi:hypothetical protein